MSCYGPQQMADAFRTVRDNTVKIAEEIPEQHYGYRATPETRSIAESLVHIALSTRFAEQLHFTERRNNMDGFDFPTLFSKMAAEERAPRSKAEILELLRSEGGKFTAQLAAFPEDALAETVSFPKGMVPQAKSRFEMLLAAKEHEMHHRGQLMVIERLLGITPHLTRQMEERMAAMKAAGAAVSTAVS
jgi:uncharacterized damage-inducible protein DinB